jgi:hypothetical protein
VSGLDSKPLGRFIIGLDIKTDDDGLSVVWPQNHWDGFLQFGLKIDGDGFWQFGLKTCCDGFLWFDLKTSDDDFLQFDLKIGGDCFFRFDLKLAIGFLVEPQNQCGGGFPSLCLKTGSFDLVICASKLPRWFLGL